ncbi:YciI family protein [Amycolatopsis carbonis]|uniref:YciI family protein n=1 Tax=Amycolatopsis carbonis TaxID=715471 RepID=A0A9Y2IK39_9PSEU|nr:YciI family protein [Amycolatopsis sp. 2-15]WIX81389.1 YciI family protein [Amycolatopsis sp. 2-15]
MRFMVIMKANEESESNQMPTTEMLAEMGKFNEELVRAGVMLAGEGLLPSSEGARVRFAGNAEPTVIDGPFAESKELVAGFWILQVKSKEEVIEWVKRVPNTDGAHHEIEIRRIAEAEDFGDNLTPELREAEEKLRAEAAKNA